MRIVSAYVDGSTVRARWTRKVRFEEEFKPREERGDNDSVAQALAWFCAEPGQETK